MHNLLPYSNNNIFSTITAIIEGDDKILYFNERGHFRVVSYIDASHWPNQSMHREGAMGTDEKRQTCKCF
uniref:Uncharacterized protein n=1 Tax=Arundo donax TaxID=35708 RepID=A0A0A9BS12_ARUDO